MRLVRAPIHLKSSSWISNNLRFRQTIPGGTFVRILWSVLALILLWMAHSAQGQNINRQMVNQLLVQLEASKADSNRFNTLLELGRFHIY